MSPRKKPPAKKVKARREEPARKRGVCDPPKPRPYRRATGKPSPELVEVLMLAGCSRERILELCGCKAKVLAESDYPDLRAGPRSAPVRTAALLGRLLELGEASTDVGDVTHVLKVMARIHLPELAPALFEPRKLGGATSNNGGVGAVRLYLPDNGRGPNA